MFFMAASMYIYHMFRYSIHLLSCYWAIAIIKLINIIMQFTKKGFPYLAVSCFYITALYLMHWYISYLYDIVIMVYGKETNRILPMWSIASSSNSTNWFFKNDQAPICMQNITQQYFLVQLLCIVVYFWSQSTVLFTRTVAKFYTYKLASDIKNTL